ncbi:hypothetical protein AAVH_26528 [Aphelenchoides avenae]|nr:hypothetical protein AAVH_26528 [Aphelenchus avenae]
MSASINKWTSNDDKEKVYEDARKDLVKCHNAECDFLEYFRDIPGVPLPAVYYARRLESDLAVSGVIIIEDLSEKRHIGGFVQSPNDTQISNVVKHFAAYHKHLLCLETDEWRCAVGGPAHLDGSLQAMYPKVWSDLENMCPGK